jgi:RNase P protein component
LLKEAFRLNQQYFPPGFDYLFMISPPPKNKLNKSEDIDEIVNNRLKRLKLEPVRNSMLTLAAKAFGKIK